MYSSLSSCLSQKKTGLAIVLLLVVSLTSAQAVSAESTSTIREQLPADGGTSTQGIIYGPGYCDVASSQPWNSSGSVSSYTALYNCNVPVTWMSQSTMTLNGNYVTGNGIGIGGVWSGDYSQSASCRTGNWGNSAIHEIVFSSGGSGVGYTAYPPTYVSGVGCPIPAVAT